PGANSAIARRANNSAGTNASTAQPSNNSKQPGAADFDRPPLASQQTADAGADQRNAQRDGVDSAETVATQSNRQVPRASNNARTANGSAVFAGSDVADQSTSSSEMGKFERSRQSKSSNSGNSGMRVRITPGAIPSSGNASGSAYDQPGDQDDDPDLNTTSQPAGAQTRPSNRASSGGGTAVFAGSGVSDDDGLTAKSGPLERERKSKVMRGGDAGLRVRIIPADQALGGSQSSDSSIFPQSDRDDPDMNDEPAANPKGSRNKSGSQLPRTNDYDRASGSANSRATYDPQNGRQDTREASEPDYSDEIAASNPRRPPVLLRESPELSTEETTDPREATGGDAIVLKSSLVNLNVSVTNRSGAAFGNLKKEDFHVAENGEAQKVEFFAPTTAPFNLVLLLDLSGSIQDKLEVIKAAAVRFLDVIEPQDRVAVVTFTDQVRVVSPLTANRNELKERILAIRRPQGGTAFYEALWFSLVDTLRNSRGQRNAIVVMTDGVDSSLDRYNPAPTRVSFNQLARRLEESDTLVFPIYLDTEYEEVFERGNSTSEAYAIGRDQLDRIAEVSGARLFRAEKPSDLAGVYKQVAAAIRTMYSVGYYPTNLEKDGTYRRVRVTVDKPDAAVRTRKGYYAK
ncbi:MAG TPA: VWA domain-containing protein, partial [Blastocatellia bacterium]|nr:VWA domain-containing protein [Blastocatellia bacterium]